MRTLAIVVVSLLLMTPVSATQGDFRLLQLWTLCLLKDPGYKTAFVRHIEANPEFHGWEALDTNPVAQCIRKMKWDAQSICSDLAAMDETDQQAVDAMFRKHAGEFEALAPAIEFIGQSTDAKLFPQSEKAPECPFD